MKAFIKYFSLIFILVSVLNSCKPDDPVDPEPEDPRDNIIGAWKCVETSEVFGEQTFTVNISKHASDSTKVLMDNFYNLGFGKKVYAVMNDNDLTMSIPSQTVEDDGHIITGNGTITSNYKSMSFTYTANDGSGELDNVTASYTLQTEQ